MLGGRNALIRFTDESFDLQEIGVEFLKKDTRADFNGLLTSTDTR